MSLEATEIEVNQNIKPNVIFIVLFVISGKSKFSFAAYVVIGVIAGIILVAVIIGVVIVYRIDKSKSTN